MIWSLIKAGLLLANALAILHEERFLAEYDLHIIDQAASDQGHLKAQIAGLLHAGRYMRLPLAIMDTIAVVSIIVFG